MKYLLPIAMGLIMLAACAPEGKKSTGHSNTMDSLFIAFYDFQKKINPIEATKAGFDSYNDTIVNYISDGHQDYLRKSYASFLSALEKEDLTQLGAQDALSARVMEWDCRVKLEGLNNPIVTMASPIYNLPSFERMPLFQIQSLHLYVAQLAGGTSVQPFATPADYSNWLQRLEDYLQFLDTCILQMKKGMEEGIVLPKVLTTKMLPQIKAFLDVPLEEHLFYQPVLNFPESFTEEVKIKLKTDYGQMITEKISPKYQQLYQFLEREYLPACRDTDGISALPHGLETYDYLIRLHTTTEMTAVEIHELGLREVDRITKEMEKVKAEIGYVGELKDFFTTIRTKKELVPFSKPEEVLAHFDKIHERLNLYLDRVFNLRPKSGFHVKRTEAFREASASAEYVPGSKDAKRPGTFYVPIPNAEEYNRVHDEALFLHEAIPGHHYQLSLQQENKDLPEFLHPESMGVFVEGWALYAESLGKELGLYQDPYAYFGMLSMEMHRAIRLVVDTGIHALGWTREEAIAYSLAHEAESEAGIITEVERYMATPGQALSYKVGQLKILELRDRAKNALGPKFDIRAFHDQVLGSGSLPLVLLEEKIDAWIARYGV